MDYWKWNRKWCCESISVFLLTFIKNFHNTIAKVLNECEKKNTYTFTADNKYSLVSYDINSTNNQCKENQEEGTYTITGKQIVLTEKGDRIGEADEATFSIANNKLTLTFEDFNKSSSVTETTVYIYKRK